MVDKAGRGTMELYRGYRFELRSTPKGWCLYVFRGDGPWLLYKKSHAEEAAALADIERQKKKVRKHYKEWIGKYGKRTS